MTLTGLKSSTLYYFNVSGCDAGGICNETGPFNFTTQNSAAPPEEKGKGVSVNLPPYIGKQNVTPITVQNITPPAVAKPEITPVKEAPKLPSITAKIVPVIKLNLWLVIIAGLAIFLLVLIIRRRRDEENRRKREKMLKNLQKI